MSIEWVRKTYRVPARRGGRVEYTGEKTPQLGTICGASGSHLSIRLDGVKHAMPFHPTWELRYLDPTADTPSSRINSTIPCYRGGHKCSWPACSADCDGRPGTANTSTTGNSKFSNGLSVEDYWKTRDEMTADSSPDRVAQLNTDRASEPDEGRRDAGSNPAAVATPSDSSPVQNKGD